MAMGGTHGETWGSAIRLLAVPGGRGAVALCSLDCAA